MPDILLCTQAIPFNRPQRLSLYFTHQQQQQQHAQQEQQFKRAGAAAAAPCYFTPELCLSPSDYGQGGLDLAALADQFRSFRSIYGGNKGMSASKSSGALSQ